MSDFLEDTVEDDEFDIQLSVLKKRNLNNEQQVYVEYDRLTYNIASISPTEIPASSRRNTIIKVNPSKLTTKIFNNKLSLSKLQIKKNHDTGLLELAQHKQRLKTEFDFIFATTTEHSYIHLVCDVVSKNVHIRFDDDVFKFNFSIEKLTEKDLEELPAYIEIYCTEKNEPSRLLGKFTISTKQLFEEHEITYKCPWLPNTAEQLKKIGFLYYNDNQIISVGSESFEQPQTNNFEYKPNLLYKQHGNVLKLQSTINDIHSFRLSDDFILYFYQKYDPAKMLGSITLNSEQLNNYNQFEIELSSDKEVRLLCNYLHLHTEEENACTYY